MMKNLFTIFFITFSLAACSSDARVNLSKGDLIFETEAGGFSISNLSVKVSKKNQLALRGEIESEFTQIVDLRCFEIELSGEVENKTGKTMTASRPYTLKKRELDFVKVNLGSSSKTPKYVTWGIGYKTKVRGLTTMVSGDLFDVLVKNPSLINIEYYANCDSNNFDFP